MSSKEDLKRAKQQALAQFQSVAKMVKRLEKADKGNDEDERDEARTAIHEDALSVQVRDGWRNPGDKSSPEEYEILLCTGGPAVRIVGKLNDYNEPDTARIEYQDWFTPWTEWQPRSPKNVEQILIAYAHTFYFGE